MKKLKLLVMELKSYINTLPSDYRLIAKSLLSQLLRISNYVSDEEAKAKIFVFINLMNGKLTDEDIRNITGKDYAKYQNQINLALNEIRKLQNNVEFKKFMQKFEELYHKYFD